MTSVSWIQKRDPVVCGATRRGARGLKSWGAKGGAKFINGGGNFVVCSNENPGWPDGAKFFDDFRGRLEFR